MKLTAAATGSQEAGFAQPIREKYAPLSIPKYVAVLIIELTSDFFHNLSNVLQGPPFP